MTNKNNNEGIKDIKFIIIFILIVTFSITYLTQSSLAKYRKQASVGINANIAAWNIKVNNESINNKTTLEQAIIPSFTGNEFVKDSVIAPGSSGYCDIIIDAKEVDVDFVYEISANISEDTEVKDLKITSYSINPTDDTQTTPYNQETTITGDIIKNSQNNIIRLYIKWEEENGTMNNAEDTLAAIKNGKANITVTLKFHQKTK